MTELASTVMIEKLCTQFLVGLFQASHSPASGWSRRVNPPSQVPDSTAQKPVGFVVPETGVCERDGRSGNRHT